MKRITFTTSKGEFILEEASDKNLGRVLVKYMTEEQFAEVVDSRVKGGILTCFKDYTKGYYSNSIFTAKQSFESLIKSLGWYLFENPELRFSPYDPRSKTGRHEWHEKDDVELKWQEAESKTLYNPIILKNP